jgi:hypothetical protein
MFLHAMPSREQHALIRIQLLTIQNRDSIGDDQEYEAIGFGLISVRD